MTTHVFDSTYIANQLVAVVLGEYDALLVGKEAIVGSTEWFAVRSSSSSQSSGRLVIIEGTLIGGSGGIELGNRPDDYKQILKVESTGKIIGTSFDAWSRAVDIYAGSAEVYNKGYMFGTKFGIVVDVSSYVSIKNSGTIEGGSYGIICDQMSGVSELENSGVIKGFYSFSASNATATATIVNRGEMYGHIALGEGDDTYDGRSGFLQGSVRANEGADTLYGGNQGNEFDGGPGKDYMAGGGGNDVYFVDNVGDVVVETANGGNDHVFSYINFSLLNFAQIEQLFLTGAAHISALGNNTANVLEGNEGNNTIKGLAGNDTLRGGLGKDMLLGGGGRDVFDFNSTTETGIISGTRDVIGDFRRLQGDRIDLRGIDARESPGGDQAFQFLGEKGFTGKEGQLRYVHQGNATLVIGSTDTDTAAEFVIQLTGRIDLLAGDFIL